MNVATKYVCQLEMTGPGDLVGFRDAVITYCAALRSKEPLYVTGPPEALDLLDWLGVSFEEGQPQGVSFVDPSRQVASEAVVLPSAEGLPSTALSEFREQGLLGTTLFAALVRSSYGPDEAGYFPTRSELGFYFDKSQLRAQVRWDQAYLEECQEFFFEELTPAELLQLATERSSGVEELLERFGEPLLGVAFLVGEKTTTLEPLTRLMTALLSPTPTLSGLDGWVEGVKKWDREGVKEAWESADPAFRELLNRELLGTLPVDPDLILLACGHDLLSWRAAL